MLLDDLEVLNFDASVDNTCSNINVLMLPNINVCLSSQTLCHPELTQSLCLSSICCSMPVAASQTLTVLSYEDDASSFESCEKVTELTHSLCPSSVCKTAFHSRSVFGSCTIQSGI